MEIFQIFHNIKRCEYYIRIVFKHLELELAGVFKSNRSLFENLNLKYLKKFNWF